MEKIKLFDDFVVFNKKLTNLREKALKLQREELATTNDEGKILNYHFYYTLFCFHSYIFVIDFEGVRMADEKCAMCNGNADDSGKSHVHIQDLCPMDRKRIAQLVEKFAECTQMKNKIESDLAEVKSENEALVNRYDLFTSKHEAEKNLVKSKLAETTAELNKLRLQTAYSLDLLTDQVKAQENEYLKTADTVRDLLQEKVKLENAIKEREMRVRMAEARIARTKEQAVMDRLLFLKDHPNKIINVKKFDQSCQTDEFVRHNDSIKPWNKI